MGIRKIRKYGYDEGASEAEISSTLIFSHSFSDSKSKSDSKSNSNPESYVPEHVKYRRVLSSTGET